MIGKALWNLQHAVVPEAVTMGEVGFVKRTLHLGRTARLAARRLDGELVLPRTSFARMPDRRLQDIDWHRAPG